MCGTFPASVLLSEGGGRTAPVLERELVGPGEAVLRWMWLSSTERCDKLLARRVAREAVQAGVPISFIAMFGCPVSCGRAAGALLWLRVAA